MPYTNLRDVQEANAKIVLAMGTGEIVFVIDPLEEGRKYPKAQLYLLGIGESPYQSINHETESHSPATEFEQKVKLYPIDPKNGEVDLETKHLQIVKGAMDIFRKRAKAERWQLV